MSMLPGPWDFYRDRPAAPPTPAYQYFWRCAHHPSAMVNFQIGLTECIWSCHTQRLEWHHGGFHPTPKSWGRETISEDT